MYKLAVCAIVKNELDLPEWCAFHKVIGADHIYIYDNNSLVPVHETLAKYIEMGYVTCIDFPGLSRQMPAYNDCLRRFGSDSQWIAMIDADEYLVPKKTDSVPDILDQFEEFGGLQVNWVLFGSNGHEKRPEGLVIENYTKASTSAYKENLHTKAIVQPQFTMGAGGNPHHFTYTHSYYAVDEKCQRVPNAWSTQHSVELLQLNHYTNKSMEDFLMKINKGRADAAHLPTANLDNFRKTDAACQVEESTILRFVDRTKAAML
jgi:hypothetical protein